MAFGEGSEVAGYRLVSLLGRGGAGAVYLADDLRLGRKVALKVLNAETADAPGVRERFVAESRIAASLDHPHIIPIYEAGEGDGQLYIAMRYVPASDLGRAIAAGGITTERAIRITGQVASALDAAHEAALIHRDVKPGNILLAPGTEGGSDHAYLTDFGLTKQATYAGGDATKSGQLLGTIGYLAPEQIQGLPIDRRVDVYSLGCVLYECLAGTAPYPRESDLAVLLAHVEAPPPSLAATRPELPPAIDAVIAKALAKHPDDRYPTAGDLARAAADALAPSASRVSAITRGFLFSDLRGYTDFVEAHGDRAAAELLETYRRLVRDVVRRYGGAEIKTEGDSFYVVFPSASSGVGCGLAIAAAAETSTREQPTRPIRVAIGIHAGESTRTEDGYVGLAVNTAARICAEAHAGEVLVSETVRSIARTGHDFTFTPRGRRHLKGIAEPVALYAAAGASTAAGAPALPRRPLSHPVATVRRHPRRAAALGAGGILVAGALTLGNAFGVKPPGSPSPTGFAAAVAPSPAPAERIVFSLGKYPGGRGEQPCEPLAPARLYLVAPDGSGFTRLIQGGSDLFELRPAWSPDGRTVAFSGDTGALFLAQIQLVGADGTGLRAIPVASDQVSPYYTAPAWSADGQHLAWVEWDSPEGKAGVRSANADGSSIRRLWSPNAPTWTPGEQSPDFVPPYPRPLRVSWLPNGQLAVVVAVAAERRGLGVVLSRPETYEALAGFEGLDVAQATWSPDGSRVALSARTLGGDEQLGIYVGKADGKDLERLTEGSAIDTEPAWSPDGRRLVFTRTEGGALPRLQLLDVASRQVQPLAGVPSDQASCSASWARVAGAFAAPPPSPSPGATPAPSIFEVGPLDAGRYRTTKFSPPLQLTVPEGWEAGSNRVDALTLVSGRALMAIARIQAAFTTSCPPQENPRTTLIGDARSDIIKWLQSNPYLKVSDPRVVAFGGASGVEVTVSVPNLPTAKDCPGFAGGLPSSVFLFPVAGDFFRIDQGTTLRVDAIEVAGKTVTIMVRSPDQVNGGDVEFILNSLTFGG